MPPFRPTRADLLAAKNKTVPDVIAPGLQVLFCGINPGLYSAAIGHHFGRPGNRFWPALHAAGFTPRLLDPVEKTELLPLGYGITNVVARATARADELTDDGAGRRRRACCARRCERTSRASSPCWASAPTAARSAARRRTSACSPRRSARRGSGCCPTPAASTPTTARTTSPCCSANCVTAVG